MSEVRYPERFDIIRLTPIGASPYFSDADARARYEAGGRLHVVPDGQPPEWTLSVGAQRYRFTLTSYAPSGTPIHEATWEREGEDLFLRRSIDLFYLDGDPGKRVPYAEVTSLTQHRWADGVVAVTFSSPPGANLFRERARVDVDDARVPLPEFGDWAELIAKSGSGADAHFGADAVDSVLTLFETLSDQGVSALDASPLSAQGGWRVPASSAGVMDAVDSLVAGKPPRAEIPVFVRGDVRSLPLLLQGRSRPGGRREQCERQRAETVGADIRALCEHRAGRGIAIDLDASNGKEPAPFAVALRAAGVTAAEYWAYGQSDALVLARAGDDAEGTLSLTLYVIPVGVLSRGWPLEIAELGWSWPELEAASEDIAGQSA